MTTCLFRKVKKSGKSVEYRGKTKNGHKMSIYKPIFSVNGLNYKASIDGEEGGKTPAAQHCGLETQRTKVPEEESCSLLSFLHPLHKFFFTSFSF